MGCVGESAESGGRAPNLKPVVSWPDGVVALGVDPSVGVMVVGGGVNSASYVSSEPSSCIVVGGSASGRGKKTERLREWIRW